MEKKFGKLSIYNLWLFTELLKHGTMLAACKATGTSHNVLSYEVKVMEETLQEKIFIRDRKKLYLTDVGKKLSDFAQETLSRFWETGLSEIPKISKNKKIQIILGTTHGIAETYAVEMLKVIDSQFENVSVKLLSGREYTDFLDTGCDIVIGPKIQNRPYLSQTALRDFEYYWFATKEYIKKNGRPQTTEDLSKHKLLIFNRDYSEYTTHIPQDCIFLESMSYRSLIRLAQSNIGIVPIPNNYIEYFIEGINDFVDLFPDTPCEIERMYFIHPKMSPKLDLLRKIRDLSLKIFSGGLSKNDEVTRKKTIHKSA